MFIILFSIVLSQVLGAMAIWQVEKGHSSSSSPEIPYFSSNLTGFGLGFAVGQRFAKAIKLTLEHDDIFNGLRRYYDTNPEELSDLLARHNKSFPILFEEVRGIAH